MADRTNELQDAFSCIIKTGTLLMASGIKPGQLVTALGMAAGAVIAGYPEEEVEAMKKLCHAAINQTESMARKQRST